MQYMFLHLTEDSLDLYAASFLQCSRSFRISRSSAIVFHRCYLIIFLLQFGDVNISTGAPDSGPGRTLVHLGLYSRSTSGPQPVVTLPVLTKTRASNAIFPVRVCIARLNFARISFYFLPFPTRSYSVLLVATKLPLATLFPFCNALYHSAMCPHGDHLFLTPPVDSCTLQHARKFPTNSSSDGGTAFPVQAQPAKNCPLNIYCMPYFVCVGRDALRPSSAMIHVCESWLLFMNIQLVPKGNS